MGCRPARRCATLLTELGEIYKAAAELYADGHDNLEDVMGDISNVVRRLTEAEANITGMISKPINGMVYWIEVQPNGKTAFSECRAAQCRAIGRKISVA